MVNQLYGPGRKIPYANTGTVTIAKGTGILIGTFVAVVEDDILGGTSGSVIEGGIFSMKAATGAWTLYASLYWDDSAKAFTTTSTGNTLAGIAFSVKTTAAVVGDVKLMSC